MILTLLQFGEECVNIFQDYATTVSQIVFYHSLGFEFLTAVVAIVAIFWDIAAFSTYVRRRRFTYWLHGAMYQKMATFNVLPLL
jgi:hypothetical protein